MRHDDRQGKRQSAALGGSGDSFFPHHIKELKNSNYSVNSDALSVCWDRPGDAAVTTWKSQGLHVMAVDFLLIEGAVGGGSAPPPALWNTGPPKSLWQKGKKGGTSTLNCLARSLGQHEPRAPTYLQGRWGSIGEG